MPVFSPKTLAVNLTSCFIMMFLNCAFANLSIGYCWQFNCSCLASVFRQGVNSLPDMPILGSSNAAENKDMMATIWTTGDTIICLSRK